MTTRRFNCPKHNWHNEDPCPMCKQTARPLLTSEKMQAVEREVVHWRSEFHKKARQLKQREQQIAQLGEALRAAYNSATLDNVDKWFAGYWLAKGRALGLPWGEGE